MKLSSFATELDPSVVDEPAPIELAEDGDGLALLQAIPRPAPADEPTDTLCRRGVAL